ncbi:alpha/beta fold hydrolase [Dictyobacter arantiisoli]|uniref:AB hydrolase-1 domain-containing protein n=1 Tax=Dictyobacter arantiisoli TaxID=2014874 RepID=A0A5A5T9Y8_9CHLR|nr:alpha/beta fold hydrolase [Dictyobacter arantiisoli]GCF08075.1 hypothetical protein KDI_16390 [Dictyobacter arantiisoli]
MPTNKTRIGPKLKQEDDLLIRETLLRVEPRVDLYLCEKWLEQASIPATTLPVILLHGAGMDSTGFDVPVGNTSLADALARQGSHTFAFDFRGHGRSSRAANGLDVTIESSITDTLAVLDYVQEITGARQFILVGVSYGSIVSSVVAERYPERIAGIVLLGFIYKTTGTPLEDSFAEAALAPAGYAFTTEEEWPELFIPTASPEVTAWHQAQFGTAYAYPVGPYLQVKGLPHARHPERYQGRVLVVTGELDPLATASDVADYLQAVGTPEAKKQHLRQNNVGHMPYVEAQAQQVQQAINEFIAITNAEVQ